MTNANGKIIRSSYLASQNRSYAIIRYGNSYVVETMDVRLDQRFIIFTAKFNNVTRASALQDAQEFYATAHHRY